MYLQLLAALKAFDIEEPVLEYQFAKEQKRRWKTDIYLPSSKIAIEIEGGAFSGGRHTRGKGFIADMHKYNAYTMLGIRLLRFTPTQATKQPLFCAEMVKSIIDGQIIQKLFKNVTK